VRPEGCQRKIRVAPSGIETATFRLVTQCINHLGHGVPYLEGSRFLDLCIWDRKVVPKRRFGITNIGYIIFQKRKISGTSRWKPQVPPTWPAHATQKVSPGPSAVSTVPSPVTCFSPCHVNGDINIVNVHKSSCELSHILVRHQQNVADNIQISVKVPDVTFQEIPTSGNQVFACRHAS